MRLWLLRALGPGRAFAGEQGDKVGGGHGAGEGRALARPVRAEAGLAASGGRGMQRLRGIVGDGVIWRFDPGQMRSERGEAAGQRARGAATKSIDCTPVSDL